MHLRVGNKGKVMKHILISLLFIVTVFAKDYTNTDFQLDLLNNYYPKVAKKLKDIQKQIADDNSTNAVYMFTSNSVSTQSMRDFIVEASFLNKKFNTEVNLVVQGFYKREFVDKLVQIKDEFKGTRYEDMIVKNINLLIDPKIFKDLNITKVPVLAFGIHKGNSYPSRAKMKYIQRGDTTLNKFFKLISKEEKQYETYIDTIIDNKYYFSKR